MQVLLYGSFVQKGEKILSERLDPRIEINYVDGDSPARMVNDLVAGADVIIATDWDSTRPPAGNLKLFQLPMSGYENVDFDAVNPQAAICNVYEHETGIAEYVMTALLDHTTSLQWEAEKFKEGDWSATPRLNGPTRGELAGKTIALIGYGHIGQAIARRAQAFDMRVVAATRNPRLFDPMPNNMVGYSEVAEIAKGADYLVVCCPLSDETTGLVNAAVLSALPSHGVVINIARAPIIDEEALYTTLVENRIAGAVLDVWYNYPTPDNPSPKPANRPLEQLDNVVMTPHISGWTDGQQNRRWEKMILNIENLIAGTDLINQLR